MVKTSNFSENAASLHLPKIVHLRATASGLKDAMIPFAVLKSDPVADFERYIEENRQRLEESGDVVGAIREAWDRPFAALRKEQVFFVCAWGAVPGASLKMRDRVGLAIAIATPGPSGRRWVTSFAVEREGELVAWCVEVDMREGRRDGVVEIVFGEENMIQLLNVSVSDSTLSVA